MAPHALPHRGSSFVNMGADGGGGPAGVAPLAPGADSVVAVPVIGASGANAAPPSSARARSSCACASSIVAGSADSRRITGAIAPGEASFAAHPATLARLTASAATRAHRRSTLSMRRVYREPS